MEKKEQLEALLDIRQMMNKSVRFLSLSGLSGFFAGLYALIAGYLAYDRIGDIKSTTYASEDVVFFIQLALATLLFAIVTAFVFTKRKAAKHKLRMWDESAKNAMINLGIPLLAGGVFCLALINAGNFVLVAPVTLIFYGLALVNTSRYTYTQLRHLGLIEIVLGLLNAFFLGYGLLFWIVGFGVMHILYGTYMYLKFDRV